MGPKGGNDNPGRVGLLRGVLRVRGRGRWRGGASVLVGGLVAVGGSAPVSRPCVCCMTVKFLKRKRGGLCVAWLGLAAYEYIGCGPQHK